MDEMPVEEIAWPYFDRDIDERKLSMCLAALITTEAQGVPAEAVLIKYAEELDERDLASIIVGLGRAQRWDRARECVLWTVREGRPLPTAAYTTISRRRMDEKEFDRAVEAIEWVEEDGVEPSGELVELTQVLATRGYGSFADEERLREAMAFVQRSAAGRALWKTFVEQRTQSPGVVVQECDMRDVPVEKLESLLGSYMPEDSAEVQAWLDEHDKETAEEESRRRRRLERRGVREDGDGDEDGIFHRSDDDPEYARRVQEAKAAAMRERLANIGAGPKRRRFSGVLDDIVSGADSKQDGAAV